MITKKTLKELHKYLRLYVKDILKENWYEGVTFGGGLVEITIPDKGMSATSVEITYQDFARFCQDPQFYKDELLKKQEEEERIAKKLVKERQKAYKVKADANLEAGERVLLKKLKEKYE